MATSGYIRMEIRRLIHIFFWIWSEIDVTAIWRSFGSLTGV
jgi:hypothetical protein